MTYRKYINGRAFGLVEIENVKDHFDKILYSNNDTQNYFGKIKDNYIELFIN